MAVSFGREELSLRFSFSEVTSEQTGRMSEIRAGCLQLGTLIDQLCPGSREKSDAMTNLEYCMYQAVASIARREKVQGEKGTS
jgi:hypothetical protein